CIRSASASRRAKTSAQVVSGLRGETDSDRSRAMGCDMGGPRNELNAKQMGPAIYDNDRLRKAETLPFAASCQKKFTLQNRCGGSRKSQCYSWRQINDNNPRPVAAIR